MTLEKPSDRKTAARLLKRVRGPLVPGDQRDALVPDWALGYGHCRPHVQQGEGLLGLEQGDQGAGSHAGQEHQVGCEFVWN